jgi:hypothetical protein
MMSSLRKLDICSALAKHGIGRRHFVEFCAAVTATLALPERFVAQLRGALNKPHVLYWSGWNFRTASEIPTRCFAPTIHLWRIFC